MIYMQKGFSLTEENEFKILSAGRPVQSEFNNDYFFKSSNKAGMVASEFLRLRFLREVAGKTVAEPYCVLHVIPKENHVSIVNDKVLLYFLERWIEDPRDKGEVNGFYSIVMENLDKVGIEAEAIRKEALRSVLRSETGKKERSKMIELLSKISATGISEKPINLDPEASAKLRRLLGGGGYEGVHERIFSEMKNALSKLHSKRVAHGDPHGMNVFITDDPDRPLILIDPSNYCWCSSPSCKHFDELRFFDNQYLKGYMRPFESEGWSSPFDPESSK